MPEQRSAAGGPWLRLKHLSFSHGPRVILKDLSLDLFPGRHYVIAGPNGAGKSTLLDLLARLRRPLRGQIELKDKPLEAYTSLELASAVSLAPQSSKFDFAFTVREVIRLGRRPYLGRWGRLKPDDEIIVDQVISTLHLGRLAEKPVTNLSGGEAQRVVLARTLAQATPVILLDEPTNSLDVAQALDLMGTLSDLAAQGALVITVTHDLNQAATFADEIIFLKDGSLVAAGPKETTLTADLLSLVFEAQAQVRSDEFTGGLALSFRRSRMPSSETH
ncbi:MAG: ABC transporter ATP-binding protein [Deltaproteobacteria bacterium]|jgi:iron complex transport system ATP-binding protein|nr:ABC transporter ATP-binding protein [Deltaproteobacteria bacterium]